MALELTPTTFRAGCQPIITPVHWRHNLLYQLPQHYVVVEQSIQCTLSLTLDSINSEVALPRRSLGGGETSSSESYYRMCGHFQIDSNQVHHPSVE